MIRKEDMWICICDKCGKKITGDPFRVVYTPVGKSIFWSNDKILINKEARKDFCEECFKEVEKVMTFIKGE